MQTHRQKFFSKIQRYFAFPHDNQKEGVFGACNKIQVIGKLFWSKICPPSFSYALFLKGSDR